MKAAIAVFALLLLAQISIAGASFVKDSAGVISNDIEIEKMLSDFYEKTNIIIRIETVENTDDIEKTAKDVFFREGLADNGISELNTVVLYSEKNREMTIAHADRCSLDSRDVMNIFSDSGIGELLNQQNYTLAMMETAVSLTKALANRKSNWECPMDMRSDTGLWFGVDPEIYEPRTSENRYGRSLDSEINPYDDGIIAPNDPLVCYLENAVVGQEITFKISSGDSVYFSRKITCDKSLCGVKVRPPPWPRGRIITCTASDGTWTLKSELVSAKRVFIFYPLDDYGLGNAREMYRTFLELSDADKSPETSVKPIYINHVMHADLGGIDGNTPEDTLGKIKKELLKTARYVAGSIYPGSFEMDKFIAMKNTIYKNSGGFAIMKQGGEGCCIIVKSDTTPFVLAHELGHAIGGLCDEYSRNVWEEQNSQARGGCSNPYPECCNIDPGEPGNCLLEVTTDEGTRYECAGMPYEDETTPDPDLGLDGAYYSIMGHWLYYSDNLIYPIEATCPLRNCDFA